MNKSILFGCVALTTLAVCVAHAQETAPVAPAPADPAATAAVPKIEDIKATVLSTLPGNGKAWQDQITVTADGDDFQVILPEVNIDKYDEPAIHLPAGQIRLTRSGSFGQQAQYKATLPTASYLDSLFKSLLSSDVQMTMNVSKDEVNLVPAHRLVSGQSRHIKDIRAASEGIVATVDTVVSDALVRMGTNQQAESASETDISGVAIETPSMIIRIPQINTRSHIQDMTPAADGQYNIWTAKTLQGTLEIPKILFFAAGSQPDALPLLTMAQHGTTTLQGETLHLEGAVDKVQTALPLPAGLELSWNADVSGLNRDLLSRMTEAQGGLKPADRDAFLTAATLKVNALTVKSDEAGMALSGTARLKPIVGQKAADANTPNLVPDVEATLVITNLDKISPPPVVNQAACDEAKARINAINPNGEHADAQRELYTAMAEDACTPRGGALDNLRPLLDPKNHQVAPDGTTTDTIYIRLTENGLSINGKDGN